MKAAISMLLILLVLGCSDDVTTRYATYADAQKERLFEKGWLPDILPRSTESIEVTNNLDINRSEGRFIIEGSEINEFLEKVEKTGKANQFSFTNESGKWVFTLNEAGLILYQFTPID
ncbi:hypothetical protein ACODM8_14895 [Vibrio ostreicida]|uniref:YbbD head domain-containing protein n=1 Tax=Vibrio ostreicida TaxID=526588 RepID=A0ABT8BZT4_9VIBR|nr:hypothetical protein [Vibrio ostreicida]MDN3612528.1 hypothetical protein [Vibrio ostreicida]NPD09153.1 hypothetical protein [Vibrio ostreicida]